MDIPKTLSNNKELKEESVFPISALLLHSKNFLLASGGFFRWVVESSDQKLQEEAPLVIHALKLRTKLLRFGW